MNNFISTVAGNCTICGYQGDKGKATSALLKYPNRVAVDSSNNLYIADTGNNIIRFVNINSGIITTVAGTTVSGYSGDNGPATSAKLSSPGVSIDLITNDIIISDYGNHRIRKVSKLSGIITTIAGTGVAGYQGDGGNATLARLNHPTGVVDRDGYIVIADTDNSVIRRFRYR